MNEVYGTPPAVIPLGQAATAVSMTPDALAAALGNKVIIVTAHKRGVRPADLEAYSPGASAGLTVIYSPANDLSNW